MTTHNHPRVSIKCQGCGTFFNTYNPEQEPSYCSNRYCVIEREEKKRGDTLTRDERDRERESYYSRQDRGI